MRSRTAASLPSFALDIGTQWYHTEAQTVPSGTISQEAVMLKPRILVTGATGKTGSVVAAELLHAGYRVRALVHRQDARSAQLRAKGAEIAVGDMSDAEHVAEALDDVQRAYYCPPFGPDMIQGA